jgi:hypothetical protein
MGLIVSPLLAGLCASHAVWDVRERLGMEWRHMNELRGGSRALRGNKTAYERLAISRNSKFLRSGTRMWAIKEAEFVGKFRGLRLNYRPLVLRCGQSVTRTVQVVCGRNFLGERVRGHGAERTRPRGKNKGRHWLGGNPRIIIPLSFYSQPALPSLRSPSDLSCILHPLMELSS